ncbi:TPA_asm: fusion protein [Guizotia abyssinica amalgavirus 1]|nr:TPA_asm: fusion protein [Guizotia abyssinica amalgavirus 1]
MSSSGQILLLEKTPEQEQAEIQAAAVPLVDEGFTASLFDRDAGINLGFEPKHFLKQIKAVTACRENETIVTALEYGVKEGFFSTVRRCDLKSFLAFSKWLQSKDGQAALHNAQKTNKLKKRRLGTFDVKDVAYEQIFTAQRADFANVVKKERELFGEQMDWHRREIKRLERTLEQRIDAAIAAYRPSSEYKEPDLDEVAALAWGAYEADAAAKGKQTMARNRGGSQYATDHYSKDVRRARILEFCGDDTSKQLLDAYCQKKILHFGTIPTRGPKISSDISWVPSVEKYLWKIPMQRRMQICSSVPVGRPPLPNSHRSYSKLRELLSPRILTDRRQSGTRAEPVLRQGLTSRSVGSEIMTSLRLRVLIPFRPEPTRAIPHSRSKYETGLRHIIGGGALKSWGVDSVMYRGGGDSNDALILLSQANDDIPGSYLRRHFRGGLARQVLGLPAGLRVPDGQECCKMKNFNNEATAGPFLRMVGVKGKAGLKNVLEENMWRWYDDFAEGRIGREGLPFLTARVGFRTKLVTEQKGWEKMKDGAPIGRAVMMLDALEQAASSPLYNVLSVYTAERRLLPECGFKNAVIKASSDWAVIWEEVKKAKVIIELDWAKFDRERPADDILFMIEVILSCFEPRGERERRLLEAYGVMLRRALVDRLIVMDEGGVFGIEGMVPSGSLWTGWLDTALNILYLNVACVEAGFGPEYFKVMCAGDDNLTLFDLDLGDERLARVRGVLNEWFRAGIVEEEFIIHRPPYFVVKRQAIFPKEVDIRGGTSDKLHLARWVEFEGELEVDEARGRSHRWEYAFKGRPKFLSNYWLREGQPIRPTADNLQKILFPEGLHSTLDDYQAAILSMVVDNPWNHHNVNMMLMRFVIVNQLRRMNLGVQKIEDVLFLCGLRERNRGPIPYPEVAPWRRGASQGRMEDYPEVDRWVADFTSFLSGVTSLYARQCIGGIDSWLFMKIIRGESHVGEGQYGNDMQHWLRWLSNHPCTKYLKPTRGNLPAPAARSAPPGDVALVQCELSRLRRLHLMGRFRAVEDFAIWVSSEIRRKRKE